MNKASRQKAAELARWWARRFYASRGDCQSMWWYLFIAEALEQGAKLPKKGE